MRKIIVMMISCLIAFMSAPVFAATTTTPGITPSVTPDGWMIIKDSTFKDFSDVPNSAFHAAHEAFMKKNLTEAANQIQKAADFIKLASNMTNEHNGKINLMAAYDELETLAKKIENGKITSARDLQPAIAEANHALAKHYYLKAEQSMKKNDDVALGRFLKSAVVNYEYGMAMDNQKIDATHQGTLKRLVNDSKKLTQGKTLDRIELNRDFAYLGSKIGKLAQLNENSRTGVHA